MRFKMLWICKNSAQRCFVALKMHRKFFCSKKPPNDCDITKLRNIGILAHIDAGKTTTTERMLFYSGTISRMGEVHHGNTVTDYMDQERERGITIRSAAVSFEWKRHRINLIDTPGHIDFTMEVEQSLQVLDGAVVVLDGSAGVEAQTLTVWRQADRYRIPRLVFINKMDRADACLTTSCKSIEEKLGVQALPLQIPLRNNDKFTGLIDVLTMEKLSWDSSPKKQLTKEPLTEADGSLFELAKSSRNAVIEKAAEWDDSLATTIIESESTDNISTSDVVRAIKHATALEKAVPVLCGSAYKNVGVQPLMDAVILYLPSPDERNPEYRHFRDDLCARCFKIVHDRQRGPLSYFRLYSGTFEKGQKVYNIGKEVNEQSQKLLVANADEFREVERVTNGNIAVLTGLKKTMMGDLVTGSQGSAQNCRTRMEKAAVPEDTITSIFQSGTTVPEPVFFCSIEPPSLSHQSALENALNELQREDPSLKVSHDSESGQTVLAGMGELHLEIIKNRILKEYKVDAELGPLQISYREAPVTRGADTLKTEAKIGNSKQSVSVHLSVYPLPKDDGKGVLRLDRTPDVAKSLDLVHPRHLQAVRQGVEVAVERGPKIGARLINVAVMLHALEVGRGTSDSFVSATVTQCIHKLLSECGSTILEPIMYLEIVAPPDYLSPVMADLNKRRAIIQNVTVRGNNKMVVCESPLSELMDYSKTLRTITSGTGSFSMEFVEYRTMSAIDESKAIESVRGF